jgi:MFS family permease
MGAAMVSPPSTPRIVSLAAACLVMLAAGTIYLIPRWTVDLQARTGLGVPSVNLVSTLANTGTWASFLGGHSYDSFGAPRTTLAGAGLLGAGYGLFAGLVAAAPHPGPETHAPPWLAPSLCVCALLFGLGGGFYYAAALRVVLGNFSRAESGRVVGLSIAWFGLSAGVLGEAYGAWAEPDIVKFLIGGCLFKVFFFFFFFWQLFDFFHNFFFTNFFTNFFFSQIIYYI